MGKLPAVLALLPALVAVAALEAHERGFPLPAPPLAGPPPTVRYGVGPEPGKRIPHEPRLRAVEAAVLQAGGWSRWRALRKLYLRSHRRRLDALGTVVSHEEESLVLSPEALERYAREPSGHLVDASLEAGRLTVRTPACPPGDPRGEPIRALMEREQFWLSHPFMLYRPGIRTCYLGTTVTRGVRCHGVEAAYDPGAAPYRQVRYFFDVLRGDLLKAEATPVREDEPVEVLHFSGRAPSATGLRLPRRRELVVGGTVREIVTLLDVASKPARIPAAPVSAEARAQAARRFAPPRPGL